MELRPDHVPARENLAGLLASLGRFEESVAHYRAALRLSPEDADTHYLLARALLGVGDRQAALQALADCLALEPTHNEAIILRSSLDSRTLD